MGDLEPFLILFPVVGGYLAQQLCHFTRERSHTRAWEQNLLEATVAGAAFFVVARLLVWAGGLWAPEQRVGLSQWIHAVMPLDFAGSYALTAAIAVSASLLFNHLFLDQRASVHFVVTAYGGDLARLFLKAGEGVTPVMVTLRNRKVYVGLILETIRLLREDGYVHLLPVLSGYREQDSLRIRMTTPYWRLYADMATVAARRLDGRRSIAETPGEIASRSGFGVVVPIDQIDSASLFDQEVFGRFQTLGGETSPQTGPAEPAR